MVHPRTLELYKQNNFEYVKTTEDYVHERFEEDTRGNPKRFRVVQIYRIREDSPEQEYLIYDLLTISTDVFGNERHKSERVGFHEEPNFIRRYDEQTKTAVVTGISDRKTVYDIPASKENIEKILAMQSKGEPSKISFVIKNGNQVFGGFTKDEFLNRHFDDLTFKSIEGVYPRELKQPAFPSSSSAPAAVVEQPSFQPQQQKKEQSAGSGKKIREIKKGLIIEEETKEE
jgi:hypothetical protein